MSYRKAISFETGQVKKIILSKAYLKQTILIEKMLRIPLKILGCPVGSDEVKLSSTVYLRKKRLQEIVPIDQESPSVTSEASRLSSGLK